MAEKKETTPPKPADKPEAHVAEFVAQSSWRSKLTKKRIIIAVVIAAILAVGFLVFNASSNNNEKKPRKTVTVPAGLTQTQKAQYLADHNEYAAAQKAWQNQLVGVTDENTKLSIYYQQSALAVRFKHYDDAKKYAEKARQLAPDSPTPYVALAQIAEAEGDKAAARKYWQEAIFHLDNNDPAYNLKKHDYQSSLDALK